MMNKVCKTVMIICEFTLFILISNMLVLTNYLTLTNGGESRSMPSTYKSATQSPLMGDPMPGTKPEKRMDKNSYLCG